MGGFFHSNLLAMPTTKAARSISDRSGVAVGGKVPFQEGNMGFKNKEEEMAKQFIKYFLMTIIFYFKKGEKGLVQCHPSTTS